MRPIDSAYDRSSGNAITAMIEALRADGREVETHANGNVSIDGKTWESEAFDRAAMAWDGSDEGLEDLFDAA